ncbi:cold shock domain protein 1, partial [Prunus dulcis]
SRATLSLSSVSLSPRRQLSLSSVRAAPATAGPETGPDRSVSPSRASLPFSPSETTNSGHELDWFEPKPFAVAPPPPPPKPVIEWARHRDDVGTKTGIMSARRARTRGRGQRWGPNPPPPSPSPPPSPPVPSPPPSPPAGDNALDMRTCAQPVYSHNGYSLTGKARYRKF